MTPYMMLSDAIEEWGFDTVRTCLDVWEGILKADCAPDREMPETTKVQEMLAGALRLAISRRGLRALDESVISLLELGWWLRERWEALRIGEGPSEAR